MKKSRLLFGIALTFLLASCDFDIGSSTTSSNYVNYTVSLDQINDTTGWVHISDSEGNILEGEYSDPFDSSIYVKYQQEKDSGHDYDFEDAFSNEMGYYSAIFDRHNYYSYEGQLLNNVRVINESYGTGEAIVVPDILYSALKEALDFSLITEDKFSIGIGNLSSLWDAYISVASSVPSGYAEESALQQRLIYTDIGSSYVDLARATSPTPEVLDNMLVFNDEDKSITFNSDPDIDEYVEEHSDVINQIKISSTALDLSKPSITLGGFGKGAATQLFAEEHDSLSYLINSGQSSIKCVNEKLDGTDWELTVANPYYYEASKSGNPDYTINSADIYLTEGGSFDLSTSGYYEQYYYAYKDESYVLRHHILDPLTGYSNDTFASASVIVSDSSYADMYTTALMNTSSISEAENLRATMDEFTGLSSQAYYLINKNVDGEKSTTCYVSSELENSFGFLTEAYPSTYSQDSITTIEVIRD